MKTKDKKQIDYLKKLLMRNAIAQKITNEKKNDIFKTIESFLR